MSTQTEGVAKDRGAPGTAALIAREGGWASYVEGRAHNKVEEWERELLEEAMVARSQARGRDAA